MDVGRKSAVTSGGSKRSSGSSGQSRQSDGMASSHPYESVPGGSSAAASGSGRGGVINRRRKDADSPSANPLMYKRSRSLGALEAARDDEAVYDGRRRGDGGPDFPGGVRQQEGHRHHGGHRGGFPERQQFVSR